MAQRLLQYREPGTHVNRLMYIFKYATGKCSYAPLFRSFSGSPMPYWMFHILQEIFFDLVHSRHVNNRLLFCVRGAAIESVVRVPCCHPARSLRFQPIYPLQHIMTGTGVCSILLSRRYSSFISTRSVERVF